MTHFGIVKEKISDLYYLLSYKLNRYSNRIKYFFVRNYYLVFKRSKIIEMILFPMPSEPGEVFRTSGFDQPLLTYVGKKWFIIGKTTKI